MTPEYIKQIMKDAGIRTKDFAEQVGVSAGSVSGWRSGNRNISPIFEQKIRDWMGKGPKEITIKAPRKLIINVI